MAPNGDITCPECNTPHLTSDPFCENCGYRIGRPETAFEGYQAIPKELAKRTKSKSKREETEPERIPAVRDAGMTKPEGHRAVKSTDLSTVREEEALKDGTLVEGLAPVKRVGSESEDPKTDRQPAYEPSSFGETRMEEPVAPSQTEPEPQEPVDESGRIAVPPSQASPPDRSIPRGLLAVIWLTSLAAAIGVTWVVATHHSEKAAQAEVPTGLAVAPKKITIPAGSFVAGLDEKVRSLILLSCQKMADDPKEQCDQDDLLAGEFPEREVDLDAFAIDNAEVRVSTYMGCVKDGECKQPDWDNCKVYTHQGYQFALRVPKRMRNGDVPVTCVTRDEAAAYCKWKGGKLPTNDQWEKAARGDDKRMFPWGNNWAPDLANWAEEDIFRTPVVGELDGFASVALPGQFPDGKSAYGLYDTGGNVAEWVADGDEGIARGGAWTSQPFDLRVTSRFELDPKARRTDVGFRCVY